jgi:hypothetical protein
VRWEITLSGTADDVARVESAGMATVTAHPEEPRQLVLELCDPEGAAVGDEIPHAAKSVIDAVVRNINGLGRLRWGRVYGGVTVSAIRSFGVDGTATQRVFAGSAVAHLLPEDFAELIEGMGHGRPEPPVGWDDIKALDLDRLLDVAEHHPDVARALHLVDLMLRGDDEIDWVAAYSALEVIEQDLGARGLNGQDLGYWSARERARFRATANSPEVLGFRSRHGKSSGVTEARMSASEASWLVRRATARWLADLLRTGTDTS